MDTVFKNSYFFSADSYFDLPDDTADAVSMEMRLGSVPFWVQSPAEAPPAKDGWRFVGQLDSLYSFRRISGVDIAGMKQDRELVKGRTHYCAGPDFGDMGTGYFFLRDVSAGKAPQAWFFWQCG